MSRYQNEETMEIVEREWNERKANLDRRIQEAERELAEIDEGRRRRLAEAKVRVADKEETLKVLPEEIERKRQQGERIAAASSRTTTRTTYERTRSPNGYYETWK